MKRVIDIDDDYYEIIKNDVENYHSDFRPFRIIANSTPLTELDEIFRKIINEIIKESEWAYCDFDEYKKCILDAEPDELPDDDFRYGLERAVEIINKYRRGGANENL